MGPNGGTDQFMYNGDNHTPVMNTQPEPVSTETPTIQWQASEFVDHQKSSGWFLLLALGAIVASGVMYLITRSIFSSIIVLLALLAFGMVAKQKPRTLSYSLLGKTLTIDQKSYNYDDFKSFSVSQDVGLPSISLQPIKRFMPVLTIYFPPEEGEKIFDALAMHLPHEQRKNDAVENLMNRIRF